MLSINALSGGDQRYYLSLVNINYYVEGGEPPGLWYGHCRHEFGLDGIVEREHLERLCHGFDPHNPDHKLVRNAGKEERKAGDDLTFSAPKSVSVAWGIGPDDLRKAIEEAHNRAVRRALDYIEEKCGWCRTGAQGKNLEKAPLLFACFNHGTSRAQDMQLHTHVLAINITVLEDGKARAAESSYFYHHKMAAGALYRCELARVLQELGFQIRQERRGSSILFEIEGVPEALIEHFSKRRAEIEQKLEMELGSLDSATARASEIAALETRRKKAEEKARSELIALWRETALEFGFTPEKVRELLEPKRVLSAEQMAHVKEGIFSRAIHEIEETKANFNERDLTRKVAEHSQGMLSCRDARELVEEKVARSGELVTLGELKTGRKGYTALADTLYATPEMIRLEQAAHRAADGLVRRSNPASAAVVEEAIKRCPTLKADQAEAVRYLCSGPDFRLCTGDAGTGKSFMLGVCRDVWRAEGRKVHGCALAGAAAQELQESSGIKSTTIHGTLSAIKRGDIRLDNSVLVIDEAGMVGSRLFYRLLRQVVRADNCRLVAVGDAKQLQPIEAGWIFKRLAQVHSEARLSEVIRQEVPWQLEAGKMMGRGHALEALTDYLVAGRLSVGRTKRDVIGEIVSRWERDGGVKESRDKLILAGLNSDVRELNLKCQAARLRAGAIDPERKVYFEGNFLHEGDRVQFSKRLTKHKIENSWVGSVEEVDVERGQIAVRLDKGDRLVTLRLKDFEKKDALRLGYASTTHKAQGRTVDYCYVLAGGPLTNRHLAYVQTTRHRKDIHLYFSAQDAGPELRVAARALAKAEDKSLAVEVIEQNRMRQQEVRRERGMSLGL